jgi:hypothetical protein
MITAPEEKHYDRLTWSLAMQLVSFVIWPRYADVPTFVGLDLLSDVLVGGSLLAVIGALRRADWWLKLFALLLCVWPAFYMFWSFRLNFPHLLKIINP